MTMEFAHPVLTDLYTDWPTYINANNAALAKFFDGETLNGTVPTGAKRYNATSQVFEKWSGSAWSEMPLAYLKGTSYTAADVLSKLLTVDGAGSGLDADLLDGQQGAAYALLTGASFTGQITVGGKAFIAVNGDITAHRGDGIPGSGVLYLGGGGTHFLYFDGTNYQFAGATANLVLAGPNIFVQGGNTVWHSGNDGSGSTLDADLLDGQDSSFFRNGANLVGGPIPPSLITGVGSLNGLIVTTNAFELVSGAFFRDTGQGQPFSFMRRSSDQVSGTVVIMNQAVQNRYSWYNPSTGVYTPGQSGDWLITGFLTIDNTSGASGARDFNITGSSSGQVARWRVNTATGVAGGTPVLWCGRLVAGETVAINVDIAFSATVKLTAGFQHLSYRFLG